MFGIGRAELIILGLICLVPVLGAIAALVIVLVMKNKGPRND